MRQEVPRLRSRILNTLIALAFIAVFVWAMTADHADYLAGRL